ncbi:hypothetical protein [Streptomyces antimycoticus]|uniref:hypothetical protein n=1 Tax=Streptomyces antimycoticus TaxID=68175 RepID=UPI0025702904|nr:hypothetical protein [Streptomyces antimycoticus]WJE00770.1 hypothetical protein QR300_35070 [Streptomyces antimycoticus]
MFTPYQELDALLADLIGTARSILGDTFVGAYLQGSFALGAGDLHSDCDFIVVTTVLPSGAAEAELLKGVNIPFRLLSWAFPVCGEADGVTWCGAR